MNLPASLFEALDGLFPLSAFFIKQSAYNNAKNGIGGNRSTRKIPFPLSAEHKKRHTAELREQSETACLERRFQSAVNGRHSQEEPSRGRDASSLGTRLLYNLDRPNLKQKKTEEPRMPSCSPSEFTGKQSKWAEGMRFSLSMFS